MTTREIEVRQATVADLDRLVPLFDAYRQFYRQPSEPERARSISPRIARAISSFRFIRQSYHSFCGLPARPRRETAPNPRRRRLACLQRQLSQEMPDDRLKKDGPRGSKARFSSTSRPPAPER